MVLHAGLAYLGVSSFLSYITFYDTDTKDITEYDLGKEITVLKFFEKVQSKVEGELGCLCIAGILIQNETRKMLINFGLKMGYKKVKIIEQTTAIYFYTVYYSYYIPKNGDIIWIYDNMYWYIRHKQDDKAKCISSHYSNQNCSKRILKKMLHKSNMPPSAILFRNEFGEFDEEVPKEMFPKCEIFEYVDVPGFKDSRNFWNTSCYKGALVQARIMANDAEMMKYDAFGILSQDLCLITKKFNDIKWFWLKMEECKTKENERKIKGIQRYIGSEESLPITKKAIIKSSNTKNILSVISGPEQIYHTICFPVNKKYAITLNIDENGISDIDIKLLGKIKPILNLNKKYSIPQKITEYDHANRTQAVGIDLGTTRCFSAVNRSNRIETVALDNNNARLLPSYVAFDEEHEKCGQVVLNRLWHYSKYTVFDSKRIIGKKFEDILIDQSWPFEVVQDKDFKADHLNKDEMLQVKFLENNDVFIKVETKNGKMLKHPEEIPAALLKNIKQKVEAFQGGPRNKVMITVPTTFTDAQKDSTCAAAILAGFQTVDFLPEPVAAAFAYLINQSINDNFNFLLFDLGGGTLDVCIFKCEKNQIEILCQNGDSNLGGRDFDNVLINYFLDKLFRDFGIKDLRSKKYKLMLECQRIKESLSIIDKEFFDVENFISSDDDGIIEITQKIFEELSVDLLEKIKKCIFNALDNGKFDFGQIDKILLVGGGSRMPMIKSLLQSLFANAEFCCASHPEELVALGAAYYAYYLESLLWFKHGETSASLKNYKMGKRKSSESIFEEEVKLLCKKLKLLSVY